MKKVLLTGVFLLGAALGYAQNGISSTRIGLNLGDSFSVLFEDVRGLNLKDNQQKRISEYQRQYEKEYNDWYKRKRYNSNEISRKREEILRNINIQIEGILTVEQVNYWNNNYKKGPKKGHGYYKNKWKHDHLLEKKLRALERQYEYDVKMVEKNYRLTKNQRKYEKERLKAAYKYEKDRLKRYYS